MRQAEPKTRPTKENAVDVVDLAPVHPPGDSTTGAGASMLVTDHGRTIIHHDVVAKIAGTSARRTEGVHALVPFGAKQSASAFARRITGERMRELGVQVEIGRTQAAVDVRVIISHGISIPQLARSIQERVSQDINRMTGLEVVEVNIEVVDLFFDDVETTKTISRVA